jgi:predicted DNA-binding transcriptional regulator AlpA
MNEPDELMTTAEVAAFLRTPAATMRYWRSKHAGPRSFRLPRRVVYWRSDVLAWLADQQSADSQPKAS